MRTNIVVPVKNPSAAKQRLSEFLNPAERRELAVRVFQNLLNVLAPRNEFEVLVVTDSEEIETVSAAYRVSVLREKIARGETEAVESATRQSCEEGFDRQIVIPADLPCVDRKDIDTLLAVDLRPPYVVLSPATGDDGTNAIMTAPPDVFKFRFGKRSFPDYLDQARRLGIPAAVVRLPSLVLDLDTPDDLRTYLAEPRDSDLYRLMLGWNLLARMEP